MWPQVAASFTWKTFAQRSWATNPLDSVIEVLDQNGAPNLVRNQITLRLASAIFDICSPDESRYVFVRSLRNGQGNFRS
jgi:hypothetical protein